MKCKFCRIIDGELPASMVHREDDVAAFLDIHPINPGHVLIVPVAHGESIVDVDPAVLGRMARLAARIGEALRSADIRCEGFDLFLADGEAAGQEVPHAHLHVIPRFGGDGFGFRFPEGYSQLPDRSELDRIADGVRDKLSRVLDASGG